MQSIERSENTRVRFVTPQDWQLEEGESILINGICSTAQNISEKTFDVDYMPETLRRTTLSDLSNEQRVNLERSLTPTDLMGGHMLYGHIDTIGTVKSIKEDGDAHFVTISIDKKWTDLIVDKGPIAIDGISLTIIEVAEDWFTISLITHTIESTNLYDLTVGTEVNIEIDMNAKYIKKIIKQELYAKEE